MKNTLIAFLRRPTTITGIVMAVMFQLIFSIVWMTGYAGVTEKIGNLKVMVVNEDAFIGNEIASNISEQLPFETESADTLDEARQELIERRAYLVIHIPADFSQQLQTPGEKGQIHYLTNESNPSLIKNMMGNMTENITSKINQEVIKFAARQMVVNLSLPAPQTEAVIESLSDQVVSDVEVLHPVPSMADQMVPMMLVLASYVGGMIMALNLEQTSMALATTYNKWKRFVARVLIHGAAGIVVALVGTSLVLLFGAEAQQGFMALWGFMSLFVVTFMLMAQLFLLFFGPAGMIFNIIMLSVQLVSSGAMLPRDLLPGFYQGLSNILPATYAVDGTMNLLFGGPSVASETWALLAILFATLLIGLAAVAIRKSGGVKQQNEVATDTGKRG